jgi:NDP-sugar pyrophosphorylase family protein
MKGLKKAMILAAGYGTRLRPLTNNLPKPLIPVGGKPMIHYVLNCLKKNGIEEVVINLHYLGNMIREKLGDGKNWGLKIHYTEEKEILGTGGGIKNAEEFLKDETFLVINTDILVKIDLKESINFHLTKGGIATLILRPHDTDKYNNITVDEDGKIIDIAGALGTNISQYRNGTFTGIHIIEPEIFNYLPPGKSSITECYINLIKEGKNLFGFFTDVFWRDLGNMDDYLKVNEEINNSKITFNF